MKKLLYLSITLLFFISCDDSILDVSPRDQLTDDALWGSPDMAHLVLNDIYNDLNPGPWSSIWLNRPTQVVNDPLDNLTDNSMAGPVAGVPSEQLFANGSYGPSNLLFNNHWQNMYASIRKTNLFIERVSSSDELAELTKNELIAQARFLRGYYYKSLIDLYGGIPLITSVLDRNVDEDIFFPRNSYEESVSFIQNEMEAAAEYLPFENHKGGRATWGAAMALKGQMELHAGLWDDAAQTSMEIMQSGLYDLFTDYGSLFYEENEGNEEVIFDIQYMSRIKGHAINTFWGPAILDDGFGWGSVGPTQNLVDDYEFKDGLTANEGSVFYDPAHPYENRDDRFYATIIYDGSDWRGTTIYTRTGINSPNEINIPGSRNGTRTGYHVRKLLDPSVIPGRENLTELTGANNIIVFRFAEVLLNYAEARNESSGPDQSVYEAINRVRERVNQPPLSQGLSQDEMRQRIRRERRIELAFEGHRFFDIRRWRIAEEVFSEPGYGIVISDENGQLQYERVPVRTVNFDASKNYLNPLPQYAIDRNPKLEQNPGY